MIPPIRGWRSLLLVVVGASLFAAAFPPLDVSSAAFIALVPLLLVVRDKTLGRAFLLGWLFGSLACTAGVSTSVFEASSRYFDQALWLRVLFALGVPQLYAAPYFGVFTWGTCYLLRGRPPAILATVTIPAAWVTCEFARSIIGHGSPWLLLAHSQHRALPLLQIAELTGAFGVSFVVAAVNIGLLYFLDALVGTLSLRQLARQLMIPVLLAVSVLWYGWVQLAHWEPVVGPNIRVALIQGNVPAEWRSSARRLGDVLARMKGLTEGVMPMLPDLVIWPENAVGFAVRANEGLFVDITKGLDSDGKLLLGAPRTVPVANGQVQFRNAAFLLDAGGHVTAHYDKRRLTPFAEYAPWPTAALTRRRFSRNDVYAPGSSWTLFDVKGRQFATLICYEAIYPGLVREFVRRGAEFLVNISNDDWFGRQPALSQHLYAALLRAVENRRTLIRVTNTGITAVIDPTGAVIARAPAGVATTITTTVTANDGLTFYTRWGDLFAWGCVTVFAAALVVGGRIRGTNATRILPQPF